MSAAPVRLILALNSGSSSLKVAHFTAGSSPRRRRTDALDGVTAPERVLEWLEEEGHFEDVVAVGHRIVHGGPIDAESRLVDSALLAELRNLLPLDSVHMPGQVALVEGITRRHPDLPQVACFDTAFHRAMPRVARLLPIPRRFEAAGMRRYGFHGLSYASLMEQLARESPRVAAGRVILAHLGSGASLAAVKGGEPVDTTMGLTPTGGLVMSTRTGDVDPGVLVQVMRTEKLSADQMDDLVSRQSGLLGVSETSADMRTLLAAETGDPRAAEAVALFCYQARKSIGALAAALGGLDGLVFAGGVGEHSPEVRERIASGLDFLGVRVDASRNAAGKGVISTADAACEVRVLRTDEEGMIARLVSRQLSLADDRAEVAHD